MPTTHTVIIKDHAYIPAVLTIEAEDSVIWDNQDDVSHTADGDQFEFSTGNIPAGNASEAVTFSDATGHSGISYHCLYHGHMVGRVNVLEGGQVNLALSQATNTSDYSEEEWLTAKRHMLEFWLYDMADDLEHAIANATGDLRTQLFALWDPILEDWRNELNSVDATIADHIVLKSAPENLLVTFGRRLRAAISSMGREVKRHPDPQRPMRAGSDDPFGKAITVFKYGDPNHPIRKSYNLEEAYAGAAYVIELRMDLGLAVPDNLVRDYEAAKSAISVEDYLILAQHLVDGLASYFGTREYNDELFAAGIWRMTYAGEWEQANFVGWHWAKWVDAYLGALKSGEVPDLIELPPS